MCRAGAAPRLKADGDQSAMAMESLGRTSWSRMLSRRKEGRRGSQDVYSSTAARGSDGDQALLRKRERQSALRIGVQGMKGGDALDS